MVWQKPVIEPRPGCGVVKQGPGTLSINSELKLTGVINIEKGILDLTNARLDPGLRFNLAEGAGLKLPSGQAVPCDALFFSDEKQAPGIWGGKGSVAAKKAEFESPLITGGTLVVKDTGLSARERWTYRLALSAFAFFALFGLYLLWFPSDLLITVFVVLLFVTLSLGLIAGVLAVYSS